MAVLPGYESQNVQAVQFVFTRDPQGKGRNKADRVVIFAVNLQPVPDRRAGKLDARLQVPPRGLPRARRRLRLPGAVHRRELGVVEGAAEGVEATGNRRRRRQFLSRRLPRSPRLLRLRLPAHRALDVLDDRVGHVHSRRLLDALQPRRRVHLHHHRPLVRLQQIHARHGQPQDARRGRPPCADTPATGGSSSPCRRGACSSGTRPPAPAASSPPPPCRPPPGRGCRPRWPRG